jgi:hypothetical protein
MNYSQLKPVSYLGQKKTFEIMQSELEKMFYQASFDLQHFPFDYKT